MVLYLIVEADYVIFKFNILRRLYNLDEHMPKQEEIKFINKYKDEDNIKYDGSLNFTEIMTK